MCHLTMSQLIANVPMPLVVDRRAEQHTGKGSGNSACPIQLSPAHRPNGQQRLGYSQCLLSRKIVLLAPSCCTLSCLFPPEPAVNSLPPLVRLSDSISTIIPSSGKVLAQQRPLVGNHGAVNAMRATSCLLGYCVDHS